MLAKMTTWIILILASLVTVLLPVAAIFSGIVAVNTRDMVSMVESLCLMFVFGAVVGAIVYAWMIITPKEETDVQSR